VSRKLLFKSLTVRNRITRFFPIKKPPFRRRPSGCHLDLIAPFSGWFGTLPEQVAGRSLGQFPTATLDDLCSLNTE